MLSCPVSACYPLEEYTKSPVACTICALSPIWAIYTAGRYQGYIYDLCHENSHPCDDVLLGVAVGVNSVCFAEMAVFGVA